MEARHRIAGHELAALDPIDHRQETYAKTPHPMMDVSGAALDIGLGPGPRPALVLAEFGKAEPVAQREIRGIADALATLLRRIDKEHPAKAFPCQPAERRLLVPVEHDHGLAAVEQVERGRNPGDARADDQDVAVLVRHGPPRSLRPALGSPPGHLAMR